MTLLNAIGKTPLIKLQRLSPNPDVAIWVKCEFLNPTGSVKDRVVAYIVTQAERRGLLQPGDTLIESTSGNTGAAVAMIAAMKGYKAILVVPDKISQEKRVALKAFGAEVIVMPTHVPVDSPSHYTQVAKQIHQTTPNSFYINQYHNNQNPEAHYLTTGPEIWEQMKGQIDVFVTVAGSGGTVTGIGRYLKEKNSAVQVVVPDPVGSVYYHYFKNKTLPDPAYITPYQVEGAGSDYLMETIDFSVIDDIIQFTDQEAFWAIERLAHTEGILSGGSGGANIWVALKLAEKMKGPANIVTLVTDSGFKYLSKMDYTLQPTKRTDR